MVTMKNNFIHQLLDYFWQFDNLAIFLFLTNSQLLLLKHEETSHHFKYLTSTVCFLVGIKKYLLIPRA